MPKSMWAVIIQAAVPLGVDLVNAVLALHAKEASGTPLTEADWNALAEKWASKTAEQYAKEAIARAGLK